jgi:ABC-type Fe3+/spermidine/putrescine transport system ATPase subunit/spermidine/putrescine-binding protein
MTSITLDGLSKHYGPVAAVDDLSLRVEEGEFVTILGPSGSGKTTVLSLIAGLVAPSSGAIRLGERNVTSLPPARRNIGLVFQSYALFPHLTVRSNIAFPLAVRKTPAAEIDRRVKQAIALLRLSGLEERRPSQLSGGQQQRVALARAIVFQPDILLLDEPLAALDRKLREEVQVELRRLQRTLGTTTLLVTHDQEEALSLSDRVLVMENGRLQQLGTPKDLYLRPQNAFVAGFLGIANLLDGAIRHEGGRCVLVLEHGVTMPMPPGSFSEDENVRVVIRPERAQLVPRASDGRRGLAGRIDDAVYLGQSARYHVDIGLERPFVAGVTDGRMTFSVGDEVLISWDEQDIWPLPAPSARGVSQSRSQEATSRTEKAMLNRREALELGACFALTIGIMQPRKAGAQPAPAKEIRIIAAGGQSGESVQAGYINPFTARTGIKIVREDTAGTPLGKLRAMVESGRIDAVLHEIGGSALAQATALGLVEPLDWAKIDPAPIFPEARNPHGLGYQYFSVIPAWRAEGAAVADWRDFWDARKFPGKRSLPDIPYYALPIALLADGVAPDALYPIDLDRAFTSLDRIKPHVSVWWGTGAQAPQLLSDNEVQFAAVYSGRVTGNPKLGYTFNQGVLGIGYFVVAKGAAEDQKLAAYGLLHEMTLAKNQAEAAKIVSYTGNSPDLDLLLPKERLGEFPTTRENKARQILPNDRYWFDNAALVEKRWQQFKLTL